MNDTIFVFRLCKTLIEPDNIKQAKNLVKTTEIQEKD